MTKYFSTLLGILLLSATFIYESASATGVDPSLEWKRLETEHFIILHDSRHYELARLYAEASEQSFRVTSQLFREWPKKTTVLLLDNTDQANGFATGVPYSMIAGFPVLPMATDSISDYGNWAYELMVHEHTHILTFHPANGAFKPLRYVFGNIVRPNMFLPRWWLEGIAVYVETAYSANGRLRSPHFMAIPRAMIEMGELRKEDISRANEVTIPDFPGGIRPYLFGAMLWQDMIRDKKESVIGDLNQMYSRRFPFVIDGPVESVFGINYQKLLERTYDRAEERGKKQMAQISAGPHITEIPLTQKGFFNHTAQISPDGNRMLFVGRDHNKDGLIFMVERESSDNQSFSAREAKVVTEAKGVLRASWFPDNKRFVYDAMDTFNHYYEFSDLYIYDLDAKDEKQITKGLRAREPVLSPNGERIVFVQQQPGHSRLATVNARGDDFRVLHETPLQWRVSRPDFLNDNEIVFVERDDKGREVLKVLNLDQTRPAKEVLTEFSPVGFPRATPEGLIFSSSINGVPNLYLANAGLTSARPISNTMTRLMTAEIDPRNKELWTSRLYGDGHRLAKIPAGEWRAPKGALPLVEPILENQEAKYKPEPIKINATSEDYSAWPYMWPRYWIPFVYLIPGGVYYSASTAGNDPLGRHAYAASVLYDTLTNRPSWIGQYQNQQTPLTLSLLGADYFEFIYSGNYIRRNTQVAGQAAFVLPSLSEKWKYALGYQYMQTDLASYDLLVRQGPQVSVSYSNISMKGREISPEKGGSFLLQHTQYLSRNNAYEYEQSDARGSLFFSKWLPERHAIALFLNASVAPRLGNVLLGRTTVGANFSNALTQNAYVMRGYPSGAFIGKNILHGSAEYRFPISYPYRGATTTPFFIQRLHFGFFADGISLDGYYFDVRNQFYRRTHTGRTFVGTGGELRIDMTAFYHLPMTLILGGYYGVDNEANDGLVTPFIGLGL